MYGAFRYGTQHYGTAIFRYFGHLFGLSRSVFNTILGSGEIRKANKDWMQYLGGKKPEPPLFSKMARKRMEIDDMSDNEDFDPSGEYYHPYVYVIHKIMHLERLVNYIPEWLLHAGDQP